MLPLTLFISAYCLLLILLYIGWKKSMRRAASTNTSLQRLISVIIPVRNEQGNLQMLIRSLSNQEYKNFEVIIVNDHSTDQTELILNQFELPWLKVIRNSGEGKKAAITSGVIVAKGDVIATTDGDCSVPASWLARINQEFLDENTMFVFGPVAFTDSNSFFSDLQSIEFSSLIGSAASSSSFRLPTMCNGANLAYRRKIFMEVGGYESNEHIASGDDEFLMRKVYSKYPDGVRFMAVKDSTVTTLPQRSLRSFFRQRIRWAAKWRFNTSVYTQVLAFLIFATNVMVLLSWINLSLSFSWTLSLLLLAKLLLEAIFLSNVSRFLDQRWNWAAFIVLQFAYPFYVIITAISSLFVVISWKGRKV
jgi:poly-beta-1,6-N-acetyl-D-glucosamine synthase